MLNNVVPELPPLLKTAAGEPLLADLITNDFNLVRPPMREPVDVAVFATIAPAIQASLEY
jgi:hypothetical protein|tara:strand:- start:829 stop:1008 length:180 start_codon:yes stop_codon:yes gene_type:complete